jgi:hypothetical protein
MSTAFIPTGPSTLITGNTTAVQGNIVTTGAYSTQYLRIDNTSNANVALRVTTVSGQAFAYPAQIQGAAATVSELSGYEVA